MHYHAESRLHYDVVRFISVLSYLTIVGWLIAAIMYGKHKSALARFHLRQSLGLILTFAILVVIPLVGWFLAIAVFVAWCVSVFYACLGQRNTIPIIGDFYQIHLDFIK